MKDLTPLIDALKILFTSGVAFVKALIGVTIELFQLAIELIRSGLQLLP